jgi:hypothetical protein
VTVSSLISNDWIQNAVADKIVLGEV